MKPGDLRAMTRIVLRPYASALPPLQGSPPRGSATFDQLQWPVTIRVNFQPGHQRFLPGLNVPDTRSFSEQAAATVYDVFDPQNNAQSVKGSSLVRQIGFGLVDLKLHRAYDPARDGDVMTYAREILQRFTPAPLPADPVGTQPPCADYRHGAPGHPARA